MKIAIEGCAHGELEKIYETIECLEKNENMKVDILICCGDFQSTRNMEDLQTMAVPKKFQDICTFYKYYSGEKVAPILTLFIGGNHEASNYLQELPYGGWVAPNIYYMGLAGVVNINGIRIAGISGIFKSHDYLRGHHEFSPYSESTIRSVYHVRQLEVFRLKQLSGDVDICISHDWPRGVYNYGNNNQLIRFKPHFRDEIERDTLGSPPCEDLLHTLQPTYWFSAHLHCKFAALIPHKNCEKTTKFLALDKCLPKRRFLQIIEMETKVDLSEKNFKYDLEWLTILSTTNHLISTRNINGYMPGPNGTERYDFTPTKEEKERILEKLNNDLTIPKNFYRTVEPYNPNNVPMNAQQPKSQINPQTTQICDLLGIDDPLSIAMIVNGQELNYSQILENTNAENANDTAISDDEEFKSDINITTDMSDTQKSKTKILNLPEPKFDSVKNPDEIEMDSEEDNSKNSSLDNVLNSTFENENKQENLLDNSNIEEEKNKQEDSLNSGTDVENSKNFETPPKKQFKRRNESIYASTENNDE